MLFISTEVSECFSFLCHTAATWLLTGTKSHGAFCAIEDLIYLKSDISLMIPCHCSLPFSSLSPQHTELSFCKHWLARRQRSIYWHLPSVMCRCIELKHQSKIDRKVLLISKSSNVLEKEVVFRVTVSSHLVVITQTEWWMGRVSLQDPSGSSLGFQGPSSIMKVVAI